jgi:transcriptional regulator with XRE-family HTH domain
MIPREKVNEYYEDYINEISSMFEEDKSSNLKLGEKIKRIRDEKGLTLADIAKKTGFDEELLKNIEDEKFHPPLSVIIKLSKALDVMTSSLFSEGKKKYSIIKLQNHKLISRKAKKYYKYFTLSEEVEERHMDSFIVKLYPHNETELTTHEGEEFIYVLDGEVKLVIEDKVEILKIGDVCTKRAFIASSP